MSGWISVKDHLPEEKKTVLTKLHDRDGIRNETELTLYRGLWFFPDKSMYVYYDPTHWKELDNAK